MFHTSYPRSHSVLWLVCEVLQHQWRLVSEQCSPLTDLLGQERIDGKVSVEKCYDLFTLQWGLSINMSNLSLWTFDLFLHNQTNNSFHNNTSESPLWDRDKFGQLYFQPQFLEGGITHAHWAPITPSCVIAENRKMFAQLPWILTLPVDRTTKHSATCGCF